jgi:NarL family two-component system response regulator LiaR
MKKTRILIADDHSLFSEGIRNLIEEEEDFEVVGQARDGEEAVRLATELEPDVVVVDIVMPQLNGIEAAKRIKATLPTTSILMLSGYDYEAYLLQAMRAGAAGFLSKGARSSEVIAAIRAVSAGDPAIDQKTAYRIITRLVSTDDSVSKPTLDELHERELEVLRLGAKGMTNKEIAQELMISQRTVQTHFNNIFRKLDVRSRTEAILRALKQRWITLDDLP